MITVLFAVSLFFIVSCGSPASVGPSKDDSSLIVKPIYYGNGVYYFPCIKKVYAVSLAAFLADSTKRVTSAASDNTKTIFYSATKGYFVTVENINKK